MSHRSSDPYQPDDGWLRGEDWHFFTHVAYAFAMGHRSCAHSSREHLDCASVIELSGESREANASDIPLG